MSVYVTVHIHYGVVTAFKICILLAESCVIQREAQIGQTVTVNLKVEKPEHIMPSSVIITFMEELNGLMETRTASFRVTKRLCFIGSIIVTTNPVLKLVCKQLNRCSIFFFCSI